LTRPFCARKTGKPSPRLAVWLAAQNRPVRCRLGLWHIEQANASLCDEQTTNPRTRRRVL
jgi:hypothetical protein